MNARFGDLAGRGPLGFKGSEPVKAKQPSGKHPAYLAAVRELPCCICENWGFPQFTPTHAHHTFCGRYGQAKTPDRQAIPLCHHHHQGADGIHTDKAAWVALFGPDTDYIAQTQDRLAHILEQRP